MSTLASVSIYDIYSNLPSAGIPGRMFYVSTGTNAGNAYRDNGTSWDQVADSGGGGSGALTLIDSVTASNSSPDATILSCFSATYDTYQIEFVNLLPANNNDDFVLEFSANGGSTWDQTSGHYCWMQPRFSTTSSFQGASSSSDVNFSITGDLSVVSSTASNGGVSGTLKIFGPFSGNKFQIQGNVNYYPNSLGYYIWFDLAGGYLNAAAVDSFRIRAVSGGNIFSGSVRIYGLST